MASGMGRLEKFLKRKTSAISQASESDVVSMPKTPTMPATGDIPRFPSPSFIRPKGTRMAARQEVAMAQPDSRTYLDLDVSEREVSLQPHKSNEADILHYPKLFTMRSMPALDQYEPSTRTESRNERAPGFRISTLDAMHFPVPNQHSRMSQRPISPGSGSSPRTMISSPELYTPPNSDSEADLRRTFMKKKLPPVPVKAPPTPDQSPPFGPSLPHSQYNSQRTMSDGCGYLPPTPTIPERSLGPSLMSRSNSDASVALSATYSLGGSTLKEPELSDFLDLTDDDIAENPDIPMLPAPADQEPQLPSMSLAVSQSRARASRLLTLSPPRTTQAATAAAFEAARIANRYDFDLIYVVNLWPEHPQVSSVANRKPMVGRLLAAFGLQNLSSPLQISSAIHTSILKSQGWIEYRNTAATRRDLCRGYACSFYPGEFPASRKGHPASPVSGVRLSERIDRGIVFAAYRRPRKGSDKMGHSLKRADLGKLHNEAEALVEMLIDIHTMNRLRCSTRRSNQSDESFIGPIPIPQVRII